MPHRDAASLHEAALTIQLATVPQWTFVPRVAETGRSSTTNPASAYFKPVILPLITFSQAPTSAEAQLKPPQFIMSLARDLQGNLWAGSEGEGIWRLDSTGRWKQFTVKDGLGDDFAYALACDRLGRIWAGHLSHGVSVYNGQKWQNYEVAGGLSRRDTLSGPLGGRTFRIAVCPTDGDVWIASSAGLARYSEKQQTWSYYTRAEGLPSDQRRHRNG